jgi:HlyD family secretion protein
MTAQLRIAVSETDDVLKIPNQALRFRPRDAGLGSVRQSGSQASNGGATVWLVGEHGRPSPVAVRIGASDDDGAALLDGPLDEGQRVIIGVANSQSQASYFGIRLGF